VTLEDPIENPLSIWGTGPQYTSWHLGMYVTDQLPPGKHSVAILDLPVENSCPRGHENVTTVPKAVSRLDARAPSPGCNGGQSEIDVLLLRTLHARVQALQTRRRSVRESHEFL